MTAVPSIKLDIVNYIVNHVQYFYSCTFFYFKKVLNCTLQWLQIFINCTKELEYMNNNSKKYVFNYRYLQYVDIYSTLAYLLCHSAILGQIVERLLYCFIMPILKHAIFMFIKLLRKKMLQDYTKINALFNLFFITAFMQN